MTAKDRLHRLVEELPEAELLPAERFLEYLRVRSQHPLLKALAEAPIDDEPLSDEDLKAIAEADDAISRGAEHPWEEVRARLLRKAS